MYRFTVCSCRCESLIDFFYTLFPGYLPRRFQTAEIAFRKYLPLCQNPSLTATNHKKTYSHPPRVRTDVGSFLPVWYQYPKWYYIRYMKYVIRVIYMPASSAAPPTAPRIAAVGKAANAPPPVMPAAVIVVVGMMPEVNGASSTAVAPEKAGVWVVADGFGVASAIMGLRTLRSGQRGCPFEGKTD